MLNLQTSATQDAKGQPLMTQTPSVVQLKQETLAAFQSYVHEAELGMRPSLDGTAPFLWSDEQADRSRRVRKGEIPAQPWSKKLPVRVANGLIHDWIGAACIQGATIAKTLARVQDYDHHKDIYKPDVMDS